MIKHTRFITLLALSSLILCCPSVGAQQNQGWGRNYGYGYNSAQPYPGYVAPGWNTPGSVAPGMNPYRYGSNAPRNPYAYGNPYGGYGGGYAAPYGGVYGMPQAAGGGFFRFGNVGGYWRAPSGLYYPMGGGGSTVIIQQQGQASGVAAKPEISTMVGDLRKFLDDSKEKGQLSSNDFSALSRRLNDLSSKMSTEAVAGNGSLDPVDDENMRRDLSMLQGEIVRRLRP